MNLDRVTMTGPDESIGHPENLLALTTRFPFVEWGILVSDRHTAVGTPRFPAEAWIRSLLEVADGFSPLQLSLHLCGRWVRELLLGNLVMPEWLLSPRFQRIQLNFHAERTECKPAEFCNALLAMGKRQFIFQIDGATGNQHLEALWLEDDEGLIDAVPLFDVSGGAGIVPSAWPQPNYGESGVEYYGYAGGLGPHNLLTQLPLIEQAAGDIRAWIDMETHIRSNRDHLFDLAKVRRCLEVAETR